jgi:hypothetical protein
MLRENVYAVESQRHLLSYLAITVGSSKEGAHITCKKLTATLGKEDFLITNE